MSEISQVETNNENPQLKTEHIAIQICSNENSLYYPNHDANHKNTPCRYDINGGLVRVYCFTHGDKYPCELYDPNIEPMCYLCCKDSAITIKK